MLVRENTYNICFSLLNVCINFVQKSGAEDGIV